MTINLNEFLKGWDENYKFKAEKLPIFDSNLTAKWDEKQKQQFVRIFYHARGHFHDFLWYLGNHTDSKKVKEIILDNIAEELNYSSLSHEQMYEEFAKSLNVDLTNEILEEENYVKEIKQFNKGHIEWLTKNCPNTGFAALSAYERLDNIDYIYLFNLAKSLGVEGKGLIFFKVHTRVEHFESTVNELMPIWNQDCSKVISSFNFIAAHQLNLWDNLGKVIFSS